MKVLIIGGTGTISTDVTKHCVSKGWDVTLLNRGKNNNALCAFCYPDSRLGKDSVSYVTNKLPEGANLWQMDINDEAAVKARLKEYGTVFDVVVNFINYSVDEIERDIRLFSGRTHQYIFISTASAYQKPRSHYMITESTPLSNPHWQYSRDKIACEERLTTEYRRNGFPMTIVRPSHTYDDRKLPLCIHGGKGSWSTLKRMMEGKPVLVLGDGHTLWPLTHSRDFAKGFVGLMGNVSAIGEAVHITTDEALTWNQIYAAIGRALGTQPKLAHVSTDFIVACRQSYEGPLHGDKSPNALFDNHKIKRLSPGFAADVRFDQGAKIAVDYHLNNAGAQVEDPDFDGFVDKIIEAQAAALEMVRGSFVDIKK